MAHLGGCSNSVHYQVDQKDAGADLAARDGSVGDGKAARGDGARDAFAEGVDSLDVPDDVMVDGATESTMTDATIPKTFTCTIVIGPSFTYDWFTAGFETAPGIDNNRWEGLAPAQPGAAFIQDWADPNATQLWALPKISPCLQRSVNPDRVIFVGVNWTYTTAAEWLAAYEMAIKTIQSKFPDSKEIELATLIRGPNNQGCGGPEETSQVVVPPFVDAAIQMAVASHPGLIKASPKLEAPSCDVFVGPGPHLSATGARVVAKVYSDYYVASQ